MQKPQNELPGQTPPDAYRIALDRLTEAMLLSSTVSRPAALAYQMALKVAITSAPFGEHGVSVGKVIMNITKRLEAHIATLPNHNIESNLSDA
jgi:hypothetical protein